MKAVSNSAEIGITAFVGRDAWNYWQMTPVISGRKGARESIKTAIFTMLTLT